MATYQSPTQIAAQLTADTRAVASRLTFIERAALVRDLVAAVRDAVKFDPHGLAPYGTPEELVRLADIGSLAEDYAADALAAAIRQDGRLQGPRAVGSPE